MKKLIFASMLGALMFGAGVFAATHQAARHEKGTIVGEVVDIANYAMFGRMGIEHAESGTYRADHGFPIGILEDETGVVWVAVYRLPVPAAGLQTANTVLKPYVGRKVVAQGRLYRARGINLIRVALVSEY